MYVYKHTKQKQTKQYNNLLINHPVASVINILPFLF